MKNNYLKLFGLFIIIYILVSVRTNEMHNLNIFSYFIDTNNPFVIYLSLTTILSFFAYTFFSYWFLLRLKSHTLIAWIAVILTVPLSMGIRYFLEEILARIIFGCGNYNPDYSLIAYFWDNTYFGQIFLALGIIFFFFQKNKYTENQRARLQIAQNASELNYLKSQINPHFLFNTLNNIYALVNKKSDKSLLAIEKLSSLLRYTIYETEDKVLLTSEWAMIENFIELHNLRNPQNIIIKKNINHSDIPFTIAPLILLPLVENAIKHGISQDLNNPIDIVSVLTHHKYFFSIKNKKNQVQKDNVGGIGLENIRKRLSLLYPNKYAFEIEDKNDFFIAKLSIKL